VKAVYETLRGVDGIELFGEAEQASWGAGFAWRDPDGNIWRPKAPESQTAHSFGKD
jgi:hypothetical protein